MSEVINLNNTSPAAPSGAVNVRWQKGASTGTDAATGLPVYPVTANVPVMTGDSGSGGAVGLVPAPPAGAAAAGKVLKADGTWSVPPTPMTTEGDLIYGGVSGVPTRLPAGAAGQVLQANGPAVAPTWVTPSGGGGGGGSVSFGSSSPMGSTYLQSLTGGGSSLRFTNAVSAGNLLLVAYKSEGNITGVTVSDTVGTTYTLIASISGEPNNLNIYAGLAATSGVNTVTIGSPANNYDRLGVMEVAGLTTSIDTVAQTYSGTTSTSLNITTLNASDFIFAACGGYHSINVFSFSTPFSLDSQSNGSDANAIGHLSVSSAGTYTFTVTVTSGGTDSQPIILVALKGAGVLSGTEGDLYFQTSQTPYLGFVYHASDWHQVS
jgi:hypothetical protein